jgi:1-deoxy-D-xylulose-5-phosphate reductoisomerase
MPRRIAILGSTGSIGRNALAVIEHLGGEFHAVALSARSNWRLLGAQARRFGARAVGIADPRCAAPLQEAVADLDCCVLTGPGAAEQLAVRDDVDVVLLAVVGCAGLPAALAAIEGRKTLALANKETLVMAGELVMGRARQAGVDVLPVDSEHSAVFQAMQAGRRQEVRRIILTASGGALRDLPVEQLETVGLEQVLDHPTWQMGPKVTIDSATLMNKALEVIEAHHLFGIEPQRIEVVIHPESIVHSLVEFVDGSFVAHLGRPDMRTPIQYALTYPRRLAGSVEPLHLADVGRMTFRRPDPRRYPALALGYEAARAGGTAGAVLNAANEVAAEAFADGRIKLTEIAELVGRARSAHRLVRPATLADLTEADRWTRSEVAQWIAACRC